MLCSESVSSDLVKCSEIRKGDTVYEIGTGTGQVTKFLATVAQNVITCEIDDRLLSKARENLHGFKNIKFLNGDAFSVPSSAPRFDVCITSLPYSRSRDFIEWLAINARSGFRSAVAIVQLEFFHKLIASPGSSNYRSISVLAQYFFEIQKLFSVARHSFSPPPHVNSLAIRLVPKNNLLISHHLTASDLQILNQIFSFRGRLLRTAVRKLSKEPEIPYWLLNARIEDLPPENFISIIQALEAP